MRRTEKARALRKFYYHSRELNKGDEFLMTEIDYKSYLNYGFIEPVVLKEEKIKDETTKEEKLTKRKTKSIK